jgi:hypothetical protein
MNDAFRLSKSKFISGLQCPKLLWWQIHEPDAPELVPDEARQALFDQGHRVGELAQERFPGGVLVDAPYYDRDAMVRETRQAMESGAPAVYEATFVHEDVVVRVDVLERKRDGRWNLVEVKQSTKVKPEHIPDLAVQLWVLRGAGVKVNRVELMHLNRDCRYPDLTNLFTRSDCTLEVEELVPRVAGQVAAFKRMLAGELPVVEIGARCDDPWECAFKSRCWAGVPEHSIWTLYRAGADRIESLERDGVETIHDLGDGVGLTAIQDRQRRSVQGEGLIVEPELARELSTLRFPIAYLDFETVWPAIPVWNRMRPYDQAAVQVSVHLEQEDGSVEHHEWIADGPGEPRHELGKKVLEFCENAGSVVAYNASFEARCLRDLGWTARGLKRRLGMVEGRLWDLLPAVRNHVYHPDFLGSFSIKSVLPALVDDAGYEDLDVTEGGAASRELMRLMFDGDTMSTDERVALRDSLLAYCKRDTWAMVALMRRLRELAAV